MILYLKTILKFQITKSVSLNCPKYNMVKFFDGIQKYIQEKNSISTFKLKLKNDLTTKAFDNITVFLENAQF